MIWEIEYYTLIDIKRLFQVAVDAELTNKLDGTGRCTTALASLLFATIESLGVLLNDEVTSQTVYHSSDKTDGYQGNYFFFDGKRNTEVFFKKVAELGLEPIDNNDIDIISATMRNGFIHSLFPKLGMGIGFNQSWLERREILVEHDNNLTLNVAYMADYVWRATEKINYKYKHNKEFRNMVDNNSQWYKAKQEENIKKDKKGELKKALMKYPNVLKVHFGV